MTSRQPSPLAIRIAINNAIIKHDKAIAADPQLTMAAEYAARFPMDAIQIIERAIASECARYDAQMEEAESQ